jgi:hypothetical protein
LETLLATNQVDWQQIPKIIGRYSAGISLYVEYPGNNPLRLTDHIKVPDGYLSLHLRQHFGDNGAVRLHGVPVTCHYRAYGPDRHLLVDPNDGDFSLSYNECEVDEWYSWCVARWVNVMDEEAIYIYITPYEVTYISTQSEFGETESRVVAQKSNRLLPYVGFVLCVNESEAQTLQTGMSMTYRFQYLTRIPVTKYL